MLIDDTLAVFILIGTVLLIRKITDVFALGERHFGFATLSAYLEALWMFPFAGFATWKQMRSFASSMLCPPMQYKF
ncbi:hypothetical protein QVA66_04065 [Staphylococcus chromogenes]|nr:hypothetical protein [Staphylococcus chromogenes]